MGCAVCKECRGSSLLTADTSSSSHPQFSDPSSQNPETGGLITKNSSRRGRSIDKDRSPQNTRNSLNGTQSEISRKRSESFIKDSAATTVLQAHNSGSVRGPSKHLSSNSTPELPPSSDACVKLLPAGATKSGHSGSKSDKNGIKRNLSTCRLKKASDITELYDITTLVLGTGISGAVRVATNRMNNKKYAIKTLLLENVGQKKASMLHNEVLIYLQLDHPNIAKLIEVYETEKSIHLVMELCTGGELYDRLASKKKYTESDAAKVAQQMLSAINYCHQHRICHRDLKLENWVFADPSESSPLKLIDFGFSRIFNPGIPMTAMHGTVYYVSPEVMDGCYKEKCDIWSIGVIIYMLLSGSPPFNGTYDHEILVKIKRGHFSFSGTRWEGISDEAKSFISYLLIKDPDERPSAEAALKHPWLTRRNTDENQIDISVLLSMRNFALGNILQRAALGVVALGMTSKEVVELEKAFKTLDKDNKGTIELHHLAQVLIEKLDILPEEAERIFERMDQTGKREVHYSEFIASTLQAKIVKDEQLVREAFQRFDLKKTGLITLENLQTVLGDSYNGSRVEDILTLCDSNKDGVIDYDEFYNALTSDEVRLDPASDAPPSPPERSPSDKHPPRQPVGGQQGAAALSALHSMRKATCMGTMSDETENSKRIL